MEETLSHQQVAPAQAVHRTRRPKRRAWIAFGIFLLLLIALLCYIGVLGGNVRTVSPGRVYRSAQLTGNNYTADTAHWIGFDLDSVIRRYGVKTIINLRGGSPQNDYYREETAESAQRGVAHIDIPMSATHLPPPDALMHLIDAFDHAPYPILFHCQGGADRSGLVGTIYKDVYEHQPLDRAEQDQLTLRYGHLSFTRTHAMDLFFDLYRQTGNGLDLRTWIMQKYPSVYAAEPASLK